MSNPAMDKYLELSKKEEEVKNVEIEIDKTKQLLEEKEEKLAALTLELGQLKRDFIKILNKLPKENNIPPVPVPPPAPEVKNEVNAPRNANALRVPGRLLETSITVDQIRSSENLKLSTARLRYDNNSASNNQQKRVFQAIKDLEGASKNDLIEVLGFNETSIMSCISKLRRGFFIKNEGSNFIRNARYICISDQGFDVNPLIRRNSLKAVILTLDRECPNGKGITAGKICEFTRLDEKTVKKAIGELKRTKFIRSSGRKIYKSEKWLQLAGQNAQEASSSPQKPSQ